MIRYRPTVHSQRAVIHRVPHGRIAPRASAAELDVQHRPGP